MEVLETQLRKKEIGGKTVQLLHLWITGLQDAQAKPFKPGYNFAAVTAAERNENKGYGSADRTRRGHRQLRPEPCQSQQGTQPTRK